MKKKLIGILLLIAAMMSIPLVTVRNGVFSDVKEVFRDNNTNKSEKLTELVCASYRDEYCNEAINALAIILNSNYKAEKKKFTDKDFMNKEEFIKKYGEDKYSFIEKTVAEFKDKTIKYMKKTVYTPLFYLSDGYTMKSEKYPQLRDCACPWDKLSDEFEECGNINGISMNTVNELCKKGASYKEALRWFINAKV
ncbi:MAG: hypothetical protein J1E96_02920 [Ruminococcus sp.]|nr:hypothetical protein [Ruminococcus sp.]